MIKPACLAIALALCAQNASAADASGPFALALAALVGEHEPGLGPHKRHVLVQLFAGNKANYPAGKTIAVAAAKISCRVSNVAISQRSCALTFGAHAVNLTGRRASELYATLAAAGVPGDGAAGSSFEAVSALGCVIDPAVIQQNAGGGASCTYAAGP